MRRQHIFVLLAGLPVLLRLGMLVLAIGAGLDLLYHLAPVAWLVWPEAFLGHHAVGAHLVTLLGMSLTLLGLFTRRARPQPANEELALSKEG